MTLVHLNVGLAAANELDKYSLNSNCLSQRSSPTNSSLLTCDSRPHSANKILMVNGDQHLSADDADLSPDILGSSCSPCFPAESDALNHHHQHQHHRRQHHQYHLNTTHNHHPLALAVAKLELSSRSSPKLIEDREDSAISSEIHTTPSRKVASFSLPITQHQDAKPSTSPSDHHHHLHHHHHHHLQLDSPGSTGLMSPSSTSSSPISATAPGSMGIIREREQHQHQQQQQASAVKVRRPSRCEHRKSLSDLGYGKIESYTRLQRLGKGTYATVYLGRSRLSNDLVALKEILKEHDEGAPCTAIREISLLRLLRHNNIVTLHDICHTPKKLTLVFEYVGPDLYAYMRENNNLLSVNNIRLLLYQLLRGISFCHSRQVLHRDLKPQNLLINSRGELKICDFGLARAKSIPTKSYSNEVVTLWYRPPDVLLGNTDYNDSIDMWGIGCIFYEMASGRTFFPGSSVRQQLYLIFSNLGSPNRYNWPEISHNPEYKQYNFPTFRAEKLFSRLPRLDADAINLLSKFLRFRPSERITAEEAMMDSFFACLPEKIHHLNPRESIFDIPGIYMTVNPGQRLSHM